MTNYVLFYTGGGMPESEEEQKAEIAKWGAWYAGMGEALVDPGAPFGAGKTIDGAGRAVSEGGHNMQATGYTIVKADSWEAAMELGKGCPNLDQGGQVSVYETFQIPEM